MALTPKRWIGIFVLGCISLAVFLLPSQTSTVMYRAENPYYRGRKVSGLADLTLGQASAALIGLEERDAALTAEHRSPTRHLTFKGQLPVAAQNDLADAFDSVLHELPPLVSSVQVRAVAVIDTTMKAGAGLPSGLPSALWYFMPDATDGRTCLIVLLVDRGLAQTMARADRQPAIENRSFVRRILGPCAYYAAFGIPGNGVERWLRSNGYLVARVTDWQGEQPRLVGDSRDLRDSAGHVIAPVGELLAFIFQATNLSDWRTIKEKGCAHGNVQLCRRIVFAPDFPGYGPPLGPEYAVALSGYWYPNWLTSYWLLPEMIRQAGSDKFVRFWRSPASFDTAFTSAMGMPLEEWTRRWLLGRFQRPRFGPELPFGTVLEGLAVIILLTGLTVFQAARHQVA